MHFFLNKKEKNERSLNGSNFNCFNMILNLKADNTEMYLIITS